MSSKTSFAKSTELTYGRRDVCPHIACSHEWRIGSCLISQSRQILGFHRTQITNHYDMFFAICSFSSDLLGITFDTTWQRLASDLSLSDR